MRGVGYRQFAHHDPARPGGQRQTRYDGHPNAPGNRDRMVPRPSNSHGMAGTPPALSKNLALGGWRIGVARMPDSSTGRALRDRLVGIGSEIWSAPSPPIRQAAALAFREPGPLAERVSRSRWLHAQVAAAVAGRFAAAGLLVPAPQAAFYVYPDFAPWRGQLRSCAGWPPARNWPGTCCTATAWASCPPARSARATRSCACGSPPGCSTARPRSSRRRRCDRPTRWHCPGSRPRSAGSMTSWAGLAS